MENATDALIMAGEMLIFIVALTVCISSFTKVRTEVDRIVGQKETVQMAKNGDEYVNYISSNKVGSTRIVNIDTLVPSMYRAIKENYVIYIKLNNFSDYESSGIVTINANENFPIKIENDDGTKTALIKKDDKIIKITIGSTTTGINQDVNKILSNMNFYNYIKDKTFYEYIGEYQDDAEEGVSSEDRTIHRIITYVET